LGLAKANENAYNLTQVKPQLAHSKLKLPKKAKIILFCEVPGLTKTISEGIRDPTGSSLRLKAISVCARRAEPIFIHDMGQGP
jgi:hypothetical protein